MGPGEYLPITQDKKFKKSNILAPFDSSVKKFKSPYGELNAIKNATPGPGKYYTDELRIKTKKIEYLENIKRSNIDDFIPNKSQTNTNFFPVSEKLGFDIKVQRFKNIANENPGPGEYFKGKKDRKIEETKGRAKSALYLANNYIPKNNVLVPSIPYKDNGYEIGENNNLIKLESDKEIWKKDKNKVGPGSYDIDNPQSWLKNGTSWSKMKEERVMNTRDQQNLKDITRPETAIDLNIVSISSNKKNKKSKKYINKNKFQAIRHNPVYKQMMNDIAEDDNLLIKNKNRDGHPGPGQYIDIIKSSGFYKDTIPYPEFKQFFLSNNERFPEKRFNDLLGPTTYYENNNYYKS